MKPISPIDNSSQRLQTVAQILYDTSDDPFEQRVALARYLYKIHHEKDEGNTKEARVGDALSDAAFIIYTVAEYRVTKTNAIKGAIVRAPRLHYLEKD